MPQDLLSPELRSVERSVDSEHLTNPLMSLPFNEAIWHFLALIEDVALTGQHREQQDLRASVDNLVNDSKYPVAWLAKTCPPASQHRANYNNDTYDAAWKLYLLASRYASFESIYTYASRGRLDITIRDQQLLATGQMASDERYDAYDRLTEHFYRIEPSDKNPALILDHAKKVRVSGDRFWYPVSNAIIKSIMPFASSLLAPLFTLPPHLQISKFNLREYKNVIEALAARCLLHVTARRIAADRGCGGLGIADALLIFPKNELIRKLVGDTGLSGAKVAEIISFISFGSKNQSKPDIALQPLVPVREGMLYLSPSLFISLSHERNLTVVVNRVPELQGDYATISSSRESTSAAKIQNILEDIPHRSWSGNVPGWGKAREIDLVLISDDERCCMVIELKSFISPADPMEVIHRSEELRNGIIQLKTRREAYAANSEVLHKALGIEAGYLFYWFLCSDNSIGASYIQDAEFPVVQAFHFAHKLKELGFRRCGTWLENREYLPKPNVDFKRVEVSEKIGAWTARWYAIRTLTNGYS